MIPGGNHIPHFPETEAIPYGSLCLDTVETAGGRTPSTAQKHPRIHLVSNPSTIQLNDITVVVTSTDALLHLSTEKNQRQPPRRIPPHTSGGAPPPAEELLLDAPSLRRIWDER